MLSENAISVMLVHMAVMIIAMIEYVIICFAAENKKMFMTWVHMLLYGGVAYCFCRVLQVPGQHGIIGIKVILSLSLLISAFSLVTIARYYGLFRLLGIPFCKLRGYCYAAVKMQLPYALLYEDGTISNKLLFKAKRGVIWPHNGEKYLVGLYDSTIPVKKVRYLREKLLCAAASDTDLQFCLRAVGGRSIGNGTYYCLGEPCAVEDASIAVTLNRKGKDVGGYVYKEDIPRALSRSIVSA